MKRTRNATKLTRTKKPLLRRTVDTELKWYLAEENLPGVFWLISGPFTNKERLLNHTPKINDYIVTVMNKELWARFKYRNQNWERLRPTRKAKKFYKP